MVQDAEAEDAAPHHAGLQGDLAARGGMLEGVVDEMGQDMLDAQPVEGQGGKLPGGLDDDLDDVAARPLPGLFGHLGKQEEGTTRS